jgi:hypothetical protein
MGGGGSKYPEYQALAATTSADVLLELSTTYATIAHQHQQHQHTQQPPPDSYASCTVQILYRSFFSENNYTTPYHRITVSALHAHLSSFLPADLAQRVVVAVASSVPSANLLSHSTTTLPPAVHIPKQVYLVAAITLKQGRSDIIAQMKPCVKAL